MREEKTCTTTECGMVYFFTGLSGAGKTTIGSLFCEHLKQKKPNVVLLDGDTIRPVFCEDSGYTLEDRLCRAQRIFRVCKMLSEQGIDVVCCSISMFQEVRKWNRENIGRYTEIYIKVTTETLLKRNQKNLYSNPKDVVGVDLPYDEPNHSDIIIDNNGDRSPLEIVEYLAKMVLPQPVENVVDNRGYWDMYYKNKLTPQEPSLFAKYVGTLVGSTGTLLDLGCGNGRDSRYFAQRGLNVIAMDNSEATIANLQAEQLTNIHCVCDDFMTSTQHTPEKYEYVYSRFTVHSITDNQEASLLTTMFSALKQDGKFFIEVRGIHDNLYGKGEAQGNNAFFYDNHYRRFLELDAFICRLQAAGFLVEYAEEKKGFAPYGNEDSPIIRVVAKKPRTKNTQ